jgi:hypothetical protein
MDFEKRHAIYQKNELLREKSGRFTLSSLINNTPIKNLKPSPLPCSCGHYPSIDINDSEGECLVTCNGCSTHLKFRGSYAGAILAWNKLDSVTFDFSENEIIPFVDFDGDHEEFIYQIQTIRENALALKEVTVRTEKKLINLIVHWCDFAAEKSKQLVGN